MRESKTIIRICICSVIGAVLVIAQSFALNGLPAGYTELEYIQSSGTQYIDTNIAPNNNTKWELVVSYVSGQGGGNGNINGTTTIPDGRFGIGLYPLNTYYFGIAQKNISVSTVDFDTNIHKFIIDKPNNKYYIDNNEFTDASLDNLGSTASIYLGARHNATGFVSENIYSSKIWENNVLASNLVPAKRISDNVVGMYDTVSETFFTNSGTGNFIAGPVADIHIATTAYVEERFAPISTELSSTMTTIKNVVEDTIKQSDRISALHTGKQNRPDDYNDDEKCPDGYNCLLISDENGVPHWWPIITGDTSSGGDNTGGGSSSTFDASAFIAGISTTGAWGDKIYYRYDRSAGVATVMDTSTGNETGTTIQLSAGEWRVKKNDYGTIYGTSMCSVTNNGKSFSQAGNPGSTDGGQYCWCKMTGLADTNMTEPASSVGSWVFYHDYDFAADCARNCANYCAYYVRNNSAFRAAVLVVGN